MYKRARQCRAIRSQEEDNIGPQAILEKTMKVTNCIELRVERPWNDLAYALSLLQHKDDEIQKITDDFRPRSASRTTSI